MAQPAYTSVPLGWPHYGIGFTEAVRRAFLKTFTYSGRASMSEYWWWVLFATGSWFAFGIAGNLLVGNDEPPVVVSLLVLGLFGATLLPTISVTVRRLHDTGRSGWYFLTGWIPIIGSLILLFLVCDGTKPSAERYGPPAWDEEAADDAYAADETNATGTHLGSKPQRWVPVLAAITGLALIALSIAPIIATVRAINSMNAGQQANPSVSQPESDPTTEPTGESGSDTGEPSSSTPTAATGSSIMVGIRVDQPGIGLQEGSESKGFDVDVARYVAQELGYNEVQFVAAPAAQRETMLQSGQVTMIVATYAITDDRKQRVSFAGPYAMAQQDLLVRTSDAITGPAQLKGKRLCSVTGSTAARRVQEGFAPSVELVERDSYSDCVAALAEGDVDAVTTDNLILAGFAAEPQYRDKIKVVGRPFGAPDQYGVGIAKGDTELCGQINDALDKMILDGAWERALEENLGSSGFTPAKAVAPTSAEPCQ